MTSQEVWESLGGSGQPSRLGSRQGPLLIMGGGSCVWDDYAKVRPWKGEIMCVNDIGQFLHDQVAHWVTLHPEYLPGWRHYRTKHLFGRGDRPTCHSNRMAEGVDVSWAIDNSGGSSGLFGIYVGLLLGYTEIVIAGIPMDDSPHFFDPPWYRGDLNDRANQLAWMDAKARVFDGKVKSLSGRTKAWLGAP